MLPEHPGRPPAADPAARRRGLADLGRRCVAHRDRRVYSHARDTGLVVRDWTTLIATPAHSKALAQPEPLPWPGRFIAYGGALGTASRVAPRPSGQNSSASVRKLADFDRHRAVAVIGLTS